MTSALSSTLGWLNPFRYRAYVYDVETELYYLKNRYYRAKWCKFISSDKLLSKESLFLGVHQFCYCINDPIHKADYDGRSCQNTTTVNDILYGYTRFSCESQVVHVQIYYESWLKNSFGEQTNPHGLLSDADICKLTDKLIAEISQEYDVDLFFGDRHQLYGEIKLHILGYNLFGLSQCDVIDLHIYLDDLFKVKDGRWYIDIASNIFYSYAADKVLKYYSSTEIIKDKARRDFSPVCTSLSKGKLKYLKNRYRFHKCIYD